MFDLDRFIADCSTAVRADRSHKSVREVVSRVISDPAAVVAGLGEPHRADDPQCRLGTANDDHAA